MYNFRLTEEIARWAFEIICRENPNWYVAFTNPTAGPWKTIKGLNKKYYKVTYKNNKKPGTATVTITGKKGVKKSLKIKFKITKK